MTRHALVCPSHPVCKLVDACVTPIRLNWLTSIEESETQVEEACWAQSQPPAAQGLIDPPTITTGDRLPGVRCLFGLAAIQA